MKSIIVLIVLGLVGYWLYTFYQQNPESLPNMVHLQKDLVSTPLPTVGTPTPKPVAPSLDSIPVSKGPTLTHARVKGIRTDSLVFVCDQGLYQITYDRLPPAFAAYYLPLVPTPTPVVTRDPNATPVPTPTPIGIHRVAQRSASEEREAEEEFSKRVNGMQARLDTLQAKMNQYYSQSTYNNPDVISDADFANTKTEFDNLTQQLADLQSRGP
jgi:hypothetical protein